MMIDTDKDEDKKASDSDASITPIRIIDEAKEVYLNKEVYVNLGFFRGLIIGAIISIVIYLAALFLIIR
jgi:hypothetical protein